MISPLANYYGNFLSETSNNHDNKLNIENSFFDKLTEDDEARFSAILAKLEQDENDCLPGISEKEEINNILHKRYGKVKVITLPQTDIKINLKIPIRPKNPFYKNFEYN